MMLKFTYPLRGKIKEERAPQEKRKRRQRYGMLLFFLGGILVLSKGSYDVYRSLRSYTWPSVEGKIVASRVNREWHPGKSPTYYPRISYVYLVGGKEYTGNVVFFSQYGTGGPSGVQEIVDRYPEGKRVSVYYDPQDPQLAVLERGLQWASLALIVIGFIFAGVGLVGFLYWDILNKQK